MLPAHDPDAVVKALDAGDDGSARFRAADVRSILAIGLAAPEPAAAGDTVVVDLPDGEVRSFDAYRMENLA